MTDSALDSPDIYARLDPEGLLARIAGLPSQIEEAWAAASAMSLPDDLRACERILVLGMGGSGIGGALLRAWAIAEGAATPVDLVRGYDVPAYADARTLVIASSNSGNTEETLSAFQQAIGLGARCLAITTGGRLLALAREHDIPAVQFSWDGEPRSALGWSFVSLLAIGSRLGLLPDAGPQLQSALVEMRAIANAAAAGVPEEANPAKQIARRLAGKLSVIVAAEALAPVAYRWRTQINENAKSWAIAEELPEMNHNAPLGYALPAALVSQVHVILLHHGSMHPRNRLRMQLTLAQMQEAGISVETIEAPGPSLLAQMLWAIQLGDFTSYYLGLLNNVHPSPMDALEWLKKSMAAG